MIQRIRFMLGEGEGEEDFRPLEGLTPWDRRDLLALMDEVAQQFPPKSDQDAIMWGWVTTVVDRWIEQNRPVPAKLMLAYNELQEERRRCMEVAESVAEQIRTLPREHRKEIAAEVLELIAESSASEELGPVQRAVHDFVARHHGLPRREVVNRLRADGVTSSAASLRETIRRMVGQKKLRLDGDRLFLPQNGKRAEGETPTAPEPATVHSGPTPMA